MKKNTNAIKIKVINYILDNLDDKQYHSLIIPLIKMVLKYKKMFSIKDERVGIFLETKLPQLVRFSAKDKKVFFMYDNFISINDKIYPITETIIKAYSNKYKEIYGQEPFIDVIDKTKFQKRIFYNYTFIKQNKDRISEAVDLFFARERDHSFKHFTYKFIYKMKDVVGV